MDPAAGADNSVDRPIPQQEQTSTPQPEFAQNDPTPPPDTSYPGPRRASLDPSPPESIELKVPENYGNSHENPSGEQNQGDKQHWMASAFLNAVSSVPKASTLVSGSPKSPSTTRSHSRVLPPKRNSLRQASSRVIPAIQRSTSYFSTTSSALAPKQLRFLWGGFASNDLEGSFVRWYTLQAAKDLFRMSILFMVVMLVALLPVIIPWNSKTELGLALATLLGWLLLSVWALYLKRVTGFEPCVPYFSAVVSLIIVGMFPLSPFKKTIEILYFFNDLSVSSFSLLIISLVHACHARACVCVCVCVYDCRMQAAQLQSCFPLMPRPIRSTTVCPS
jgi:hypothetical protein